MNKILLFLIFLTINFECTYAGEMEIYDKCKFKKETYYNESSGENVTKNVFEKIGEEKTTSTLKNSKAEIIGCPKHVDDEIRKKLNNSETFKKISAFGHNIKECIKITYKEIIVYAVQCTVGINITNVKYQKKINEPIIWIGVEDKNKKITEVYFEISEYRFFKDSMSKYYLEAVADIDNDGQHDIIINEVGYAGHRYAVFSNKNARFSKSEIFGDSWD